MDLETIADTIRAKMEQAPKIEAQVLFDFEDDGKILYDGTVDPAVATVNGTGDPKTTLRCSLANFEGFVTGSKSPDVAYLMGQLKIEGSLGLAMKLKDRLED
jgi:putative sterol carrier protein